MAITTQAGALAGLQFPVAFAKQVTTPVASGTPLSLYAIAGSPLVGLYPNTGLTGGLYSSSSSVPQGILYRQDPSGGNAYLAQFKACSSQPCSILVCDRIWDCEPAVNSALAQTITSPSLPARDSLGQTNGLGVMLGIEMVATASTTAAVISVSYTNSAGASGRTGAFIDAPTAVIPKVGGFYRIGLQAGDQGVQSVQTVTFSTAWTSGTIALVAYRLIAKLDLIVANMPNMIDVISGGFPRVYNGTCPFLMIVGAAAATTLSGTYTETQG